MSNNLDSFTAHAWRRSMIEKSGAGCSPSAWPTPSALAQPGVTAHYIAKLSSSWRARSGRWRRTASPSIRSHPASSPRWRACRGAAKITKNIPAGYISDSDAVSCARFLLSDEARYVNGTNVLLSGGWGL
jgi:3-oxoacyl-[acyl-carrier protein] reductase